MAGELITADWQVELQGLLTGAGTDYMISEDMIDGFGVPDTKTADSEVDGQDGAYASADYMGVRTFLIPYEINTGDPVTAWEAFEALEEAWEPVDEDVELHIRLPGMGQRFWEGRPRGLKPDLKLFRAGIITAIARFDCMRPRSQVVS